MYQCIYKCLHTHIGEDGIPVVGLYDSIDEASSYIDRVDRPDRCVCTCVLMYLYVLMFIYAHLCAYIQIFFNNIVHGTYMQILKIHTNT